MMNRKQFMNKETGSIGFYDSWFYENEHNEWVNAVDLDEVVEVEIDSNGNWQEV